MSRHLVSAAVSGFHIGEGTDLEPAHFWSQGPLVKVVNRCQCRTPNVRPSVRVPYR